MADKMSNVFKSPLVAKDNRIKMVEIIKPEFLITL